MSKRQRLMLEYLVDADLTQAAIRAGYVPRHARRSAARALASPACRAALQRALEARAQRTGITAARVLDEYLRLALAELGGGASVRDQRPLSAADATALAEVAIDGDGRAARAALADKGAALAALARLLGLVPANPRPLRPVRAAAEARETAHIAAPG